MADTDSIHRFLFENTDCRGNLVHLDASWRAVLDTHPYPPGVRVHLGQALAAVALLSATIKFDSEPLAFRCGCSRDRIEDMLRTLGEPEVRAILAAQGSVEVTCEFCNRSYRLDAVDAGQLFAQSPRQAPSAAHH